MSIHEAIGDLVAKGKLIDRPSSFTRASARNLYVVPDLEMETKAPFADTLLGERYAAVSQSFDAFCELNLITVSQNPHRKPSDVMLARVGPVNLEFWAMRIIEPDETAGVRVFGGFCAKDQFVALKYELREDISDFGAEVDDAKQLWRDYFGDIPPHSGSTLDDYLTNYDEQ